MINRLNGARRAANKEETARFQDRRLAENDVAKAGQSQQRTNQASLTLFA